MNTISPQWPEVLIEHDEAARRWRLEWPWVASTYVGGDESFQGFLLVELGMSRGGATRALRRRVKRWHRKRRITEEVVRLDG